MTVSSKSVSTVSSFVAGSLTALTGVWLYNTLFQQQSNFIEKCQKKNDETIVMDHKGLDGEIISRVEAKGFSITKIKMMTISKELAEQHYGEHKDKPFFNDLVSFITSGPVVAMQVEGENVVLQIRNLMGATNPSESTPGSIRGDLATELDKNVVHGSDSDESAERELSLFFG